MNAPTPVFVLAAYRTPIGKFCGALKDFSAVELGARVIASVINVKAIPRRDVEEVIMGQVIQAGAGQNPARQAALGAGLRATASAFTVNKCCGSGLKSVLLAAQAIRAGDGDLIVAGGMESMSQAPFLLDNLRRGMRLGHGEIKDSILTDGLLCPTCHWHMGSAAEFIAKKYNISREEQDRFAFESHRKALRAQQKGWLSEEITPVVIPHGDDPIFVRDDEGPRKDCSLQTLQKLAPAFDKKRGTVTAGNAPGLNDGAAALALCSERYLRRSKVKPLARLVDYVSIGTDPAYLFTAPALAAQALLKKMNADWTDFDLIESNEAFAAQALATEKIAGWNPNVVNVHGGAIAFGHPLGASGARILVTLIHALRTRKLRRGLATICMGGGNGLAAAVEIV